MVPPVIPSGSRRRPRNPEFPGEMAAPPVVRPAPAPPAHDPVFCAALRAQQILTGAGHEAFFAGGFARDLLLGRTIHDIDIATDARPERVQELFPDSRAIGKSFGVIQISIDSSTFDVATFRADRQYRDGRHPESVDFTDAAGDANRRDFTVNGMFYDPRTNTIIDYVGGFRDLEQRLIRAIGHPELRFTEDHLRMMRAVRFATVLEFSLESGTADAIRRSAAKLSMISMERIRDELIRMFMEAPRPGRGLHLLRDTGLLAVILPEVQALSGVEQPPEYHPEGDVFVHTAMMLDLMEQRSPELIWSILMHDIAKPLTYAVTPDRNGKSRITFRGHADQGAAMAVDIMQRFRCAHDQIDATVTAVKNHMRFATIPEMRESSARRWIGSPLFPLEMELHRIDCQASHGDVSVLTYVQEFRSKLAAEPVLPPPFLTGKDLIRLGIKPGPAMGILLRDLYTRQLEGEFENADAALAWIKSNHDASTDVDKRT